MLGNLLGGFVDKEQITKDYITDALESVAKDNGLENKEICFMIKPINDKYEFKVYAVKVVDNKPANMIREVTIKEIVSPDEGNE